MADERWAYMGGKIYPEWAEAGHCPEHGYICHEHVEINGRLVQVLLDEDGKLSPEHYTIDKHLRRIEFLREDLKLVEDALFRCQRDHDLDRAALVAYRMAAETGKPLRECLLSADSLKPDFLVWFNEDGSVRETRPWVAS